MKSNREFIYWIQSVQTTMRYNEWLTTLHGLSVFGKWVPMNGLKHYPAKKVWTKILYVFQQLQSLAYAAIGLGLSLGLSNIALEVLGFQRTGLEQGRLGFLTWFLLISIGFQFSMAFDSQLDETDRLLMQEFRLDPIGFWRIKRTYEVVRKVALGGICFLLWALVSQGTWLEAGLGVLAIAAHTLAGNALDRQACQMGQRPLIKQLVMGRWLLAIGVWFLAASYPSCHLFLMVCLGCLDSFLLYWSIYRMTDQEDLPDYVGTVMERSLKADQLIADLADRKSVV